jgi:hypothetical protein
MDVHIRFENITYDNITGKEQINWTRYELRKCNVSDFLNTTYEKIYWKGHKHENPYCINNPFDNITTIGTRDNKYIHQPWSKYSLIV